MNILKLFKKRKTEEERIKEWHNSDLYKNSESIKKYWTPELIEWIGNETNPVTLAVASCLLNSWCYPSFMPSNPGDYSKAHENDLILSYFISDLMKTLEIKSEKLCPGLYKKIWISNYYDRFRS